MVAVPHMGHKKPGNESAVPQAAAPNALILSTLPKRWPCGIRVTTAITTRSTKSNADLSIHGVMKPRSTQLAALTAPLTNQHRQGLVVAVLRASFQTGPQFDWLVTGSLHLTLTLRISTGKFTDPVSRHARS